jgi:hypothetical protein
MDLKSQEASETLDCQDIRDVRNLRDRVKGPHRRVNHLLHKGVLIMEVESQQIKPLAKGSEKGKMFPVNRRILILGHVIQNSEKMVSLQIKNGNSWISHSLEFGVEKPSTSPGVNWCKGLAIKAPTGEATDEYRMKQAMELMRYAWKKNVEWKDLNQEAMKACCNTRSC